MIEDYLEPKSRDQINKEMEQMDPKTLLLKAARANYPEGVKKAIREKNAEINEWVMMPCRRDDLPDLPEHMLPKGILKQLGKIAMELTTSDEIIEYLKSLKNTSRNG